MKDLQEIIDNAPKWAYFYCESNEHYISKDDGDNCCQVGDKSVSTFCKSTEVATFDCITINQAKQILELQEHIKKAKDDAHLKKAYMLIDFGIDGSACKQVYAWLNSIFK